MDEQNTIGSTTPITFATLRGRELTGKADSGATTSCLHATNIKTADGKVHFQCPMLSDNIIELDCHGSQEVSSADGGNNERPVVRLDVVINGKRLPAMEFNLNDRSNMDEPVLIGQNILKAGGFVIDVSNDQTEEPESDMPASDFSEDIDMDRTTRIIEAVTVLREMNVTFDELVKYVQTVNVSQIKE